MSVEGAKKVGKHLDLVWKMILAQAANSKGDQDKHASCKVRRKRSQLSSVVKDGHMMSNGEGLLQKARDRIVHHWTQSRTKEHIGGK